MIKDTIEEFESNEQHKNTYELCQTILDCLNGEKIGIIKTSITLCLATCINKNDDIDDKVIDLNMVIGLLKVACDIPTIH